MWWAPEMGDGRLYVAFLGTARERLSLALNGGVSSRPREWGWFDTVGARLEVGGGVTPPAFCMDEKTKELRKEGFVNG